MTFPRNDQSIYNEDANQWSWTPEVGVEREVLGPFRSIEVMTTMMLSIRLIMYDGDDAVDGWNDYDGRWWNLFVFLRHFLVFLPSLSSVYELVSFLFLFQHIYTYLVPLFSFFFFLLFLLKKNLVVFFFFFFVYFFWSSVRLPSVSRACVLRCFRFARFLVGVLSWELQEACAKAQEDSADLKPIALPYDMELVQLKIKDKKFIKIMQGKEPSQVRREGASIVDASLIPSGQRG